jgi:hypothetical protein
LTNGLQSFSAPTVLAGPWPGWIFVSGEEARCLCLLRLQAAEAHSMKELDI